MKISGVDIRPGNIIEYEGGIWRAVKIQHTQPGKGGAYMQVELKNLIDGRKNNVRFRSAETVERVRLDTKDFQFLYHDGDMLVFMDKAEAVVKGQTASSSYKPALLDNGFRVMVPPHITSGTRIVVDVYNREYVRRAD